MFQSVAAILLGVCEFAGALTVTSQQTFAGSAGPRLDPYPGKGRVVFREDGTFKITVFSDLHFGENPGDGLGTRKDGNSTQLMRSVLADEEPEYVVLNGDLITGDFTFKENSTSIIDQIMAPLIEAHVPFSSTHGNHDNHVNITHLDEILREQRIAPLSYTRAAPRGVGGLQGPGNYWVPIYATASDAAPALILWFFDSRGRPAIRRNQDDEYQQKNEIIGGVSPEGTPVPDWVDRSVAGWIKAETAAMVTAWGPASARGALAFVHIAPHAIQAVQPTLDPIKNPGLNDDTLGGGSVQDSIDHPAGRDASFWEALGSDIENLHVVISGHAHGNEWCAREPGEELLFCFNKHSGYGGYDKEGWGHGVRNLVLASPDPQDRIETWIRLENGETRARVVLLDGRIVT
ncbi:Metallo-dependent phosphatase-like protein [Mycena vulgaris]|nr:Metallo-dependent phosphatase-like protein [Mycena vulgaris]